MCSQIAFRVDASARIGTGHFMRCLTLANALSRFGFKSLFICRHSNALLRQALKRAEHHICLLGQDEPKSPIQTEDYAKWLGVPQLQDAQDTLKALAGQDIAGLVVDHYALDTVWQAKILGSWNIPMLAIDDLCRTHSAHLILDATHARQSDAYATSSGEVLAGSHYALLRSEFAAQRTETLKKRRDKEPVSCVLLAMGGADPDNLTADFVQALLPGLRARNIRLAALTGPAYAYADRLQKQATTSDGALIHYHNTEDVARVLADADICVGAAGSSSWERCCLGLPTIGIVIAENQKDVSQELVKAGAILDGGACLEGTRSKFKENLEDGSWYRRILAPLIEDVSARHRMSEKMAAMVDGHGATRAANRFAKLILGQDALWLRPAEPADSRSIYNWRYAQDAARFYNSPTVPEYSDHENWYLAALKDSRRRLLIAHQNQSAVAHLRFDLTEIGTEIGICVDPRFRGRKIGRMALSAAMRYSRQNALGAITARVHSQNQVSMRLFLAEGFSKVSHEGHFTVMRSSVLDGAGRTADACET